MRAPGLLPLLPLLLLGVSSRDAPSARPGQNQAAVTTGTSKVQMTTPSRNLGTPPSNPTASPTVVQMTTSVSKAGNPPTPVVPPTTVQGITTLSSLGEPSSPPTKSPATVPGTTPANTPGKPPPAPTTPSQMSGEHSSSASSRASTAIPPPNSSAAQQASSPPASLGGLGTTTAANPILDNVSSPPAAPGAAGAAATTSPSTQPQGSQPSDHLPKTTVSTGVPRTDPPQRAKECVVSPSSCVTKQPHSSASSPVQEPAASTRPGSTDTSLTPLIKAPSLTTTKTSLTSQPGSIDKVSEAATTLTPGADQRGHGVGPTSAKPTSAPQSPASAPPSAPAPGNQTASSSPGHQHASARFQNEVICEDQEQDNRPNVYLKEAKSCDEWRAASSNISFFESFCSTGQHVFNASRETCTVTLTACEPRSRHWAVRALLHLPLDPEKVLEELKEKNKLEELGIVNITYDKTEREMIINDEFSTPLIITIVTLACSLLLIAAIYGCCHQRFSQKKDQHIHPDLPGFDDGHVALIFNQRLTEELQTMENGYHDNPTLEVMETSSEMQEKKVNLNGELGDSWIVPLDTLMKEDLEEEEDTHL